MALFTICADDKELLSDPLAHFGGFTLEAVRRFDYEVGRAKAQQWLCPPPGAAANPLGLLLDPASFEPIDLPRKHHAATARLRDSADTVGKQVGERVGEQIDTML